MGEDVPLVWEEAGASWMVCAWPPRTISKLPASGRPWSFSVAILYKSIYSKEGRGGGRVLQIISSLLPFLALLKFNMLYSGSQFTSSNLPQSAPYQ